MQTSAGPQLVSRGYTPARLKSSAWDHPRCVSSTAKTRRDVATTDIGRRPVCAGKKDVFKDQKDGSGGGGYYWPVPAMWRSGGADPEHYQNGVYLSHLAAMIFTGKKIMKVQPGLGLGLG